MRKFLCIHNDGEFYKTIQDYFQNNNYEIEYLHTCNEAYTTLEKKIYDVVLFDTSVIDCRPADLVKTVHNININTIIIIFTERKTEDEAIKAIQKDAYAFLKKPFSISELKITIDRALNDRSLRQEAASLRGERNLIYKTDNFIGESPEIKKVFDVVNKVAESNSTVLLTGETGTGKELIAGAIHYNSLRVHKAFVKVNCAALPEYLLESELFGHERGAFTGADKQRIGRFEQADGGTIFLDEIGDMSLTTQAKVLRIIQEREFERLGSNKTINVDVRIIAATNKDIAKEIDEKRFREDLFYRLNVVTIYIPPLRKRRGDILLLVYFFLKKVCADLKKGVKEIHPIAIKRLTEYQWPGNIRELENAVERAVLLSNGSVIKEEDFGIPELSASVRETQSIIKIPAGGIRLEDVERELILQALKMCDWVQKDAATLLGVSTRVLNYKIKRFEITYPGWKRYR
jgi:two-component system response regulator HydG